MVVINFDIFRVISKFDRRHACHTTEKTTHIGGIIETQFGRNVFDRQIRIQKESFNRYKYLMVYNLFRRCFYRPVSERYAL